MRGRELTFFASGEHACSYLPDTRARTLFVDPMARLNAAVYTQLLQFGFRRSGDYVYRPRCGNCSACVPLRIPVAAYEPRRCERRTLARNADLTVTVSTPKFRPEQYDLYTRYVKARHRHGGMDDTDPGRYMEFLNCSWGETGFYDFRLDGRLVAVAVTDRVDDALSACYTFFDPALTRRSLGVYAVLWQILEARRRGLSWVYLGYWIRDCEKMSYKDRFRPVEAFVCNRWIRHGHDQPIRWNP